jgi:hypothetical protein
VEWWLPLQTSDNGIDTTTFLTIVAALSSTISALAGGIIRYLLKKNGELEARLLAYQTAAPELLAEIQKLQSLVDIQDERWSSRDLLPGVTQQPSAPRRNRRQDGER